MAGASLITIPSSPIRFYQKLEISLRRRDCRVSASNMLANGKVPIRCLNIELDFADVYDKINFATPTLRYG